MQQSAVHSSSSIQLSEVSFRSVSLSDFSDRDGYSTFTRLGDPNYLPSIKEWHALMATPHGARQFFELCNQRNFTQYEVLTREYIVALSDYFKQRSIELATEHLRVLEVGAGNGRLSEMLRRESSAGIEFIATDNGAWAIPQIFPVLRMEIPDALKEFSPDIVLFSWMPPDLDLTGHLRREQKHSEYVLIGDKSCCGTHYAWNSCNRYSGQELSDLKSFQLCRNDRISPSGELTQNSTTMSYRKVG